MMATDQHQQHAPSIEQFRVTTNVLQNLRLARVMREPVSHSLQGSAQRNQPLNSIDFHNEEMLLVTADDGDTLSMYDIGEGKKRFKLVSKKYGLRNVTFTKSSHHVLHSSKKGPDSSEGTIRYWSLNSNTYVRYFPGHVAEVTSLCVAPGSDGTFMSAGADKKMFVWDLRKKGAAAVLPSAGSVPYAQYDNQGLVAAVATNDAVRLFDVRYWDKGPFIKFHVASDGSRCSCLRFSNDGGKLLSVNGHEIRVLDAIVGTQLYLMKNECKNGENPEACFDPSSKFVLSGCVDGNVRIWSAPGGSGSDTCGTGENVTTLRAPTTSMSKLPVPHTSVPRVLKWAPTCLLVASAYDELNLWIPDVSALTSQIRQE